MYFRGKYPKVQVKAHLKLHLKLHRFILGCRLIDGMMIVKNIYEWLNQFNCTKQIVLIGTKELKICHSTRVLTERELGIIQTRQLENLFTCH